MADRYLCSSMSKRTIRFKVQIGDYSMYVCKGYYTSPEFGDDESESGEWSLLVRAYDGADHENFIDVQLQNNDYVNEELFVNVKISIVSCIGINVLKNERRISFRDRNEARILAVAKAQLKGFYGLKKFFYLPNDTLTLQCDLEVMREKNIHLSSYQNEASFLNNIPLEPNASSEYFSHSRLVNEEDDYFCWKIQNFAFQTSVGHAISPEFQSEHVGDKWNLVLYNTHDDDYYGECMDIRLRRKEGNERKLFKTKLSLVDLYGNVLLSKEKNVYFNGPEEKQLLSLTERDAASCFGFCKKQLVQDDTLTLRCDLVLFKQIDDNFGTERDFGESIETYGYSPTRFYSYLAVICFLLLDVPYLWCFNLLTFICLSVLDLIKTVVIFVVSVFLMGCFGLKYVKKEAENKMKSYTRLQLIKHYSLFCVISVVAFYFFYPVYLAVQTIWYLMFDIFQIIKTSPEAGVGIMGFAWFLYHENRKHKRSKEMNKKLWKQRRETLLFIPVSDEFNMNKTYEIIPLRQNRTYLPNYYNY